MARNPDYPFTRGDAMRRALDNADIAPKDAALRLGVGYRTVLDWLSDEAIPTGPHLARFIELTDEVRLLDWFGGATSDSRCYPDLAGQVLASAAA